MPYVAPFHSTLGETYVFHDHDGCREGAKIKPAHRNVGTGTAGPARAATGCTLSTRRRRHAPDRRRAPQSTR